MPPINAAVSQPPGISVDISGEKVEVSLQSSKIDVDVGGTNVNPHQHGLITNDGKISGVSAASFVVTDSKGSVGASTNVLDITITEEAVNQYAQAGSSLRDSIVAIGVSLDSKADAIHDHSATAITSGILAIGRIPTGNQSNQVCVGNDFRLSNSRFPTSHALSHSSTGTDPITPLSIGAQSSPTFTSVSLTGGTTALPASRSLVYTATVLAASTVTLPGSGNQVGDRIVVRGGGTVSGTLTISGAFSGTDTITSVGQQVSYLFQPAGGSGNQWVRVAVDRHGHQISDVSGLQSALDGIQSKTLASLEDVSVQSVLDGDLLRYNSGSWRNYKESDLLDGGNW